MSDRILFFTHTIQEAKDLAAALDCEILTGLQTLDEQRRIINGFEKHRFLVATSSMATGWRAPADTRVVLMDGFPQDEAIRNQALARPAMVLTGRKAQKPSCEPLWRIDFLTNGQVFDRFRRTYGAFEHGYFKHHGALTGRATHENWPGADIASIDFNEIEQRVLATLSEKEKIAMNLVSETITGKTGADMRRRETALQDAANALSRLADTPGLNAASAASGVAQCAALRDEAKKIAEQRLGQIPLEEPWKSMWEKESTPFGFGRILAGIPNMISTEWIVKEVKDMVNRGALNWDHVREVKNGFGVKHTKELGVVRKYHYIIALRSVAAARRRGRLSIMQLESTCKLMKARVAQLEADNARLTRSDQIGRGQWWPYLALAESKIADECKRERASIVAKMRQRATELYEETAQWPNNPKKQERLRAACYSLRCHARQIEQGDF